MGNEDLADLKDIKQRLLASIRSGDVEAATDALLETWAHHGVVRGNMAALDRFAVGSGLVDGLQKRQKVVSMMASQIAKMIVAEDSDAPGGSDETDYSARLEDE